MLCEEEAYCIFADLFHIFAAKEMSMSVLERKIEHGLTTMCSHVSYPRFVLPLHKHKEYELMLFTQGSGKQFVGDEGVSTYRAGDIALIGSNVPHLHLCNSKLVSSSKVQDAEIE